MLRTTSPPPGSPAAIARNHDMVVVGDAETAVKGTETRELVLGLVLHGRRDAHPHSHLEQPRDRLQHLREVLRTAELVVSRRLVGVERYLKRHPGAGERGQA